MFSDQIVQVLGEARQVRSQLIRACEETHNEIQVEGEGVRIWFCGLENSLNFPLSKFLFHRYFLDEFWVTFQKGSVQFKVIYWNGFQVGLHFFITASLSFSYCKGVGNWTYFEFLSRVVLGNSIPSIFTAVNFLCFKYQFLVPVLRKLQNLKPEGETV